MLTSDGVGAPRPKNLEEAAVLLGDHFRQVEDHLRDFIDAVAPHGHSEQLAAAVGPKGMHAVVENEQGWDWPVYYRPADDIEVLTAQTSVPVEVAEQYSGKSGIRYLLSASPKKVAADRVTEALNQLTLSRWASHS